MRHKNLRINDKQIRKKEINWKRIYIKEENNKNIKNINYI